MLFIDVLTVSPATLLQLSLSREYPLRRVSYKSPCSTAPVLELCVDLLDTALPPRELYAGARDTALLPFNQ
jgi:hypothetical protein